MNTQLEETLRRALAEQAAELPASATAKVLAVDYRARASMAHPVFALLAACMAAAVAVAVLVVGAGTDAQRAFAGWSASPTTATADQVNRAEGGCRSQLTSVLRRRSEALAGPRVGVAFRHFSAPEWRSVLTDTRGPYTMIVLEARKGQVVATCFAGRRSQASLGVGIAVRPPPPVPPGRVAFASSGSTTTPRDEGSRQFSRIVGRTGAGVTGVAIRLNNGTRVTATCSNGWFLAWWPGSHGLAATEVTTASATKTQ